jgi:hypothetical protein
MENSIAYYALFNAHPSSRPPFSIELGTGKNSAHTLSDCKDIPDGIERILAFCKENSFDLSKEFVLLYPIYMDAMDTEFEGAMHQIAWLIKDEADAKKWKFDRIGGYTGNTPATFVP